MKKILKIAVPVVMVILILVSICWYLFVYDREFTRDVLLSRARYHTAHGNDNMASWYYNLAYDYAARTNILPSNWRTSKRPTATIPRRSSPWPTPSGMAVRPSCMWLCAAPMWSRTSSSMP